MEKLRDKVLLAKNGQTASIMDYTRFNYAAQPEDGIEISLPGVGAYDKWAIEWNYKPIYGTTAIDESADDTLLLYAIISDPLHVLYCKRKTVVWKEPMSIEINKDVRHQGNPFLTLDGVFFATEQIRGPGKK